MDLLKNFSNTKMFKEIMPEGTLLALKAGSRLLGVENEKSDGEISFLVKSSEKVNSINRYKVKYKDKTLIHFYNIPLNSLWAFKPGTYCYFTKEYMDLALSDENILYTSEEGKLLVERLKILNTEIKLTGFYELVSYKKEFLINNSIKIRPKGLYQLIVFKKIYLNEELDLEYIKEIKNGAIDISNTKVKQDLDELLIAFNKITGEQITQALNKIEEVLKKF